MRSLLLISALMLGACQTTTMVEKSTTVEVAPDAPGAYIIVRGRNYAPAELGPYAASLPPIYAKYGGRYVVFETDIDVAEGSSADQAVIISAWPSKAAARTFWDSPEYREAIKLRDGVGEFDVVIVGALPAR